MKNQETQLNGQDDGLNTPVLFVVFSRPDTTQEVFNAIRKVRPKQLFIAADGPRADKPGEAEKCEQTRAIARQVDWPCEVKTLFRDENMGCGRGVSGAITWFFDHVESGIILEDDTLPGEGFFPFCSELLEKYMDDERVMSISGSNLPSRLEQDYPYSYFFSNFDHIWGWATWRRAWKHFVYEMENYELAIKKGFFSHDYYSIYEKYFMEHAYNRSFYDNREVTWWSYQWGFARKVNSGLVIVPVKNLVINLGFGNEATNTSDPNQFSFMKLEQMNFPLQHPPFVMHDKVTDDESFKSYLTTPYSRIKTQIKNTANTIGLGRAYDKVKAIRGLLT